MKKIILILILALLVGCNKEASEEKIKNKILEQANNDIKLMNEMLIKYGKEYYGEKGEKISGKKENIIQFINIASLETMNYDISMFVNPLNGKSCDKNETGINFIIENNNDNYNYIFKPILYCFNETN